ncbi:MAG: copper-translocating P-type ATPase, partial [Clostridiales bacterium]|nr:copper-translocating P-type ATPase [Clostridiales bacterium]
MKEKFEVQGMTCSACALNVEKAVQKIPGVSSVQVNLMNNHMQVVFDENNTSVAQIANAVADAGYSADALTKNDTQTKVSTHETISHEKQLKNRFFASLFFMLPLMYLAMHEMLHLPMFAIFKGEQNLLINAFTQFLLAIPVLIINRSYFIIGFKLLFKRSPNMDSLIAVGSSAALIYGVFALYKMAYGFGYGNLSLVHSAAHELYFESAAMIVTLITFGKFLEAKSKGKTSQAIQKLLALAPKTAIVLRNGQEQEVPIEEVVKGDILAVRPGQSIPVDGIILTGNTSIDQSAITGESIPVEKHPGDSIIAATMNKNVFFTMEAQKVGDDTTFAQIIQLVEEASGSKAPIAKLADKISSIFVPTVIGISMITFVVWLLVGKSFPFSLSMAIAVLVISCPCALGLATPVAIMVATGKGAQHGILFKSAEALENTHQIQSVVLDKTGTITQGRPQVTDIQVIDPQYDDLSFLSLAASIEHPSEHPLAEAILQKAKENALTLTPVDHFEALPGKGISAKIAGAQYHAGNKQWLQEQNVPIDSYEEMVDRFSKQGKTPLLFAKENAFIGIIAVADVVKSTSKAAIAAFHQMGMEVIMLTGDNQQTAQAIGKTIGVDQIIANVLPADKEAIIRQLQSQGKKVAMIGDGINDAPALTRADVGIAIGAGTDIAIESADVVLMKSDLADALTAIELSKDTLKNIKGNLFWAFFYNTIGIPLAAGVFYPWFGWQLNPMFAAAAMSLSSVFVVTNALRLRRFKP